MRSGRGEQGESSTSGKAKIKHSNIIKMVCNLAVKRIHQTIHKKTYVNTQTKQGAPYSVPHTLKKANRSSVRAAQMLSFQ